MTKSPVARAIVALRTPRDSLPAPQKIPVHRREVYEAIQREKSEKKRD